MEVHVNDLVVLAALSPHSQSLRPAQNEYEFRGNGLGCIRVQSDRCLLFTALLLCALVSWPPDKSLHDEAGS